MNLLQNSLAKAFSNHRIVFWYDEDNEWGAEQTKLEIPGVTRLEVTNNELQVKFRLLRDEPDGKFLLYFKSAKPADEENWLLDLQMAGREFQADRVSMYLEQAGLPAAEFKDLAHQHEPFFAEEKLREKLKDRHEPDDTHRQLRRRMIAIALGANDDALDSIILELCQRLAREKLFEDPAAASLDRYRLTEALWEDAKRQYGYSSKEPKLFDFLIDVFRQVAPIDGKPGPGLNGQAHLLVSRWKDSASYRDSFEKLSEKISADLAVGTTISKHLNLSQVIDSEIDAYEVVEKAILQWLRDTVISGEEKHERIFAMLAKRRRAFWYPKYRSVYQALKQATRLLEAAGKIDFSADSLKQASQRYAEEWSRIDYFYRRFHEHRRAAGQSALLQPVDELVEKAYQTRYLLPLAKRWESLLDGEGIWPPAGLKRQNRFYDEVVRPVLKKGQKLFVIISDALRYECADELRTRLMREDRYHAELDMRASVLPSFTQLGMAALLPHSKLGLQEDGKMVEADGLSTKGAQARLKVLQTHSGAEAFVIKAEDFLKLHSTKEGRPLMKAHDVIYIYHNEIDAAGDKLESEETVTTVCEAALKTLVALTKKVTAINGSNIVVTADHGFLFQQSPVNDLDCPKLPAPANGAPYSAIARRYVIGKLVADDATLRRFTAEQLGVGQGFEIGIVRGVQRLPLKGSGKRFVHGGMMPQEALVPVLTIGKKRSNDINYVDVEIVRCPTQITTSSLSIRLFQKDAMAETEKLLGRELKAGIYTADGSPLTEEKWLKFEATEDDPRLRETSEIFTLGHEAGEHEGEEVYLRLYEKIKGSSKLSVYCQQPTQIQRHFENDFSDFD